MQRTFPCAWRKAPPLAAIAAATAIAAAACGQSDGHSPQGAATPSVEAVQARFGALPLRDRLTGTVLA